MEEFIKFERELLKDLLDNDINKKYINKKYQYMVVKFYKIEYFDNKSDLEKYLVSLQPDYTYNNLSELAIHLINIDKIIDISINFIKN